MEEKIYHQRVMERIHAASGTRTQVELATLLEIRLGRDASPVLGYPESTVDIDDLNTIVIGRLAWVLQSL